VLVSPFVSVARGVAVTSLVTRAVITLVIPFGRLLSEPPPCSRMLHAVWRSVR
jgi:hypothetical protein